jgi:hypothetical protein
LLDSCNKADACDAMRQVDLLNAVCHRSKRVQLVWFAALQASDRCEMDVNATGRSAINCKSTYLCFHCAIGLAAERVAVAKQRPVRLDRFLRHRLVLVAPHRTQGPPVYIQMSCWTRCVGVP